MAVPTPDRAIVAKLKRLDPGLSAEFVDPPGRWGIFHDLQTPGNFEQDVDSLARALREELAKNGYILPAEDVAWKARQAVLARRLVHYVTEADSSYRPLDDRVIQKLEKMSFLRRNWGLRDWKEQMDIQARILRERQERDQDTIWSSIARDKVFARHASDILWGNKPVRSVIVPAGIEGVRP